MKVALFSAFPQETAVIIKRMRAKRTARSPFNTFSAQHSGKEIVVVESGMGCINSETAWNHVFEKYRPDYIISAGFCGAFHHAARIGDVVVASRVFLYPNIAETTASGPNRNSIVELRGATEMISRLAPVVSVHEGTILTLTKRLRKSQVARKLPAGGLPFPVCDMETFPLARLSIREGIPFFAVRAVSDRAHEEIPSELFDVTDEYGNYSLSRAIKTILAKPALIPSCFTMGKNAWVASHKLYRALEKLLLTL
jgi:nucleoside phosphorylase